MGRICRRRVGSRLSSTSWEPIAAIPAQFIDIFRKAVKDEWWARRDKDNIEKDILKAAQVMRPSDAEELRRLRKEKQKKSMRPLRIHFACNDCCVLVNQRQSLDCSRTFTRHLDTWATKSYSRPLIPWMD